MDKEEAIGEFLKSWRITLNNAAVYQKGHPALLHSAEAFKQKIDAVFSFLNPITINITPHALAIEAKYWDKEKFAVELAELFHRRKIKTIIMHAGMPVEELFNFISEISRPAKDILKAGGPARVFSQQYFAHFLVEELDYSLLLEDQGEDAQDIWSYLFGQAVVQKDTQKINEFADSFSLIIKNFKLRDLLENEELRQNLYNFINYLKEKNTPGYQRCSKDLLKRLMHGEELSETANLDILKTFFKDADKNLFADTLSEEILNNTDFNLLSFKLFSHFVADDKHREVAPELAKRIKGALNLKDNLMARKKIKELFSAPGEQFISPFYQQALTALLAEGKSESQGFQYEPVRKNFFSLLLNLLLEESDNDKLKNICAKLMKEVEDIIKDNRSTELELLFSALQKKKEKNPVSLEATGELEQKVMNFIEGAAFVEQPPATLNKLIGTLKQTSLGLEYYIEKIFQEEKVNPLTIKLFISFFPNALDLFYENLKAKSASLEFLEKILHSLDELEAQKRMAILKKMYVFSNTIIKIEILKIMQELSIYDLSFLLAVLKDEDFSLKKQALVILARQDQARKAALRVLFSLKSRFGRKNNLLIENINLIEAWPREEIQPYLSLLAKRPFFWNQNIRLKARQAMGK